MPTAVTCRDWPPTVIVLFGDQPGDARDPDVGRARGRRGDERGGAALGADGRDRHALVADAQRVADHEARVAATLTFVAPAAAGANSVVERDCVPTAATSPSPTPSWSVSPTTKLVTLATFTFVAPAAAASDSVEVPGVHRNSRASL